MPTLETLGSKSRFGLGCSRLGSVTGASSQESEALIAAALANGINFFDTSDIYAQGDSERLLAKVLGKRSDVVICTKIGKVLSPAKRLLLPFKQIIRSIASNSASAHQGVKNARAKPMPTNWSPAYLERAIDKSLRRLKRDHIDILMLHSPDAMTIRMGAAIDVLSRAREKGKIGHIGISVDTVEASHAALADSRVTALQVPVHPGSQEFAGILMQAAANNVGIVAREIFGGATAERPLSAAERAACLAALAGDDRISVSLIGTTKVNHLLEALRPQS